jgi:hypothetical protein
LDDDCSVQDSGLVAKQISNRLGKSGEMQSLSVMKHIFLQRTSKPSQFYSTNIVAERNMNI